MPFGVCANDCLVEISRVIDVGVLLIGLLLTVLQLRVIGSKGRHGVTLGKLGMLVG